MGKVVRAVGVSLVLVITAAAGASAQAMVGLQGGIIHSTLTGGQLGDVGADLGIHGQLSVTLPFQTGPLGLRAALAFAQRGATYRPGGVSAETRASMDYLQLPLLLTLNTAAEGQVSLHAFGGIAPSVMVSCQYVSGTFTSDTCDEGVYIRGTYFEWLAGAGVTVRRGATAIVVDTFFNQGMSSIFDSGGSIKTRAITLIAGVEIPLRREETP